MEKTASILFSYVDFEQQSLDVVNRLINDYSEVFDFNMINSTLLKTTSQLTSEISKIKLEYANSMKQMKKLFNDQKEELISISKKYLNKEKEEDRRAEEREELFKQQINKLKEENEKQKKIFTENLNEMKKKQEEVIGLGEIKEFQKLIRESMRVDVFNEISFESKKFFIKNIIQNNIQFDDDNKESCYLARRIIFLKEFFELISKIEMKYVDLSEQIDFIYNQINELVIDFNLVEFFFQKKILQKKLTKFINCIDNIIVEIKYPSDDFNDIFAIVSKVYKEVHDNMENPNLNEDQDEPFKIVLIISDIKRIDQSFKDNIFINNVKFEPCVKKNRKTSLL